MRMRIVVAFLALAMSHSAFALCLQPLCTCTMSTTPMIFSAYNPLSSGNVDSSANIAVACRGVVGLLIPYTIGLSTGASGSFSERTMTSGAAKLRYNLYGDASFASVLGDGTASSYLINGNVGLDLLGLSLPFEHRIYGRIAGGQRTTVPGAYTDNIFVTVTYY